MSKVYVVTDGDWEEYRVMGVCSTREKALRFAAAIDGAILADGFELDDYPDQIDAGLSCWLVSIRRSGLGWSCSRGTYHSAMPGWHVWGLQHSPGDLTHSRLSGTIWARDMNEAKTITNEKRAQLIASGEWPPD